MSNGIAHADLNSPSPLFPCSLPPLGYLQIQVQSVRACGDWPWTMNGNEAQRLAHAINALRPDWMISSLTTFIGRNMASWPYRDAAVALTFVACDTKPDGQHASDTPKRVLEQGPWRVAAAAGGSTAMRAHAPKRHEECPIHAGQWAHNCGGCRAEGYDPEAATSPEIPSVDAVNPGLAGRLAKIVGGAP